MDVAAGEFWDHPYEMALNGHNLSSFERNHLFLNVDGTSFIEGSFASGVDLDSDSRSAMVGDFNGDAAPDLLVASAGGGPLRLFFNRTPGGSRLELQLVGTMSNRAGLGARVIVESGDRRAVRELFAPNGFMGHSPPRLYLGADGRPVVDRLTILWPGGKRQVLTDVPTNSTVTAVESGAVSIRMLTADGA
jgi:hypothetical protein